MMRVLLVEDQPHNMRLMEQVLEDIDENMHLVKAGTGNEALARAKEEEFDIILMDIALPDMDGLCITQTIKAYPHLKDTPVIAVTAYAMLSEEAHFKATFSDYVSKPIDEDKLSATIRKWIGDKLK